MYSPCVHACYVIIIVIVVIVVLWNKWNKKIVEEITRSLYVDDMIVGEDTVDQVHGSQCYRQRKKHFGRMSVYEWTDSTVALHRIAG